PGHSTSPLPATQKQIIDVVVEVVGLGTLARIINRATAFEILARKCSRDFRQRLLGSSIDQFPSTVQQYSRPPIRHFPQHIHSAELEWQKVVFNRFSACIFKINTEKLLGLIGVFEAAEHNDGRGVAR